MTVQFGVVLCFLPVNVYCRGSVAEIVPLVDVECQAAKSLGFQLFGFKLPLAFFFGLGSDGSRKSCGLGFSLTCDM